MQLNFSALVSRIFLGIFSFAYNNILRVLFLDISLTGYQYSYLYIGMNYADNNHNTKFTLHFFVKLRFRNISDTVYPRFSAGALIQKLMIGAIIHGRLIEVIRSSKFPEEYHQLNKLLTRGNRLREPFSYY